MTLPGRLDAIQNLVPHDSRLLADIGCGEGQLIQSLRHARPSINVVGVDPSPHINALLRSKREAGLFGALDGVTFRPGGCFTSLRNLKPDTAVFAGLGENTIADSLLSGIPDSIERLILSPVQPRAVIRLLMPQLGWRVVDETLSRSRNRYYLATAFERGDETRTSDTGFLFGAIRICTRISSTFGNACRPSSHTDSINRSPFNVSATIFQPLPSVHSDSAILRPPPQIPYTGWLRRAEGDASNLDAQSNAQCL